MKLNAERIKKRAISGGARSGIDFLVSEEVAKAVADRLRAYLKEQGYNPPNKKEVVRVKPSTLYEGTWRVEFWRGLNLPNRERFASANKQRADFARKALESVFRPEDL